MTRLLEDTNLEKYFIRIVKQNELIIKSKGQKDTIKAQKSSLYDSILIIFSFIIIILILYMK